MAEFLLVAFSGQRGDSGLLLIPEQILGQLHYAWLLVAAFVAATLWNLFFRLVGTSLGRAAGARGAAGRREPALDPERARLVPRPADRADLLFGLADHRGPAADLLHQVQQGGGHRPRPLHPSSAVLAEGVVLLVQTIFLAFMATAFAIPFAFALSFLAARNLTRTSRLARFSYTAVRATMNFVRAVEPLVWALIFISWVGIGPFAGVLSLWVHSVASLVKLYSEQIESIDQGPVDAIKATGAGTLQILRYGVVPQVIPPFLSFTIYRWDINVRMSTIIGFVGGGGIGYILKPRVDLGNWSEVGTLVLLIAVTVWLMDFVSAKIRERIV